MGDGEGEGRVGARRRRRYVLKGEGVPVAVVIAWSRRELGEGQGVVSLVRRERERHACCRHGCRCVVIKPSPSRGELGEGKDQVTCHW